MDGWNSDISEHDLKCFLDEKASLYNHTAFIDSDPIQVPHQFSDPADIEIAAFFTAILAWGRKTTIINSARDLISRMKGGPHNFITNAREEDLDPFLPFVHRTFNGMDCIYFIRSLQRIYLEFGGLENVFTEGFMQYGDLGLSIIRFRELFFQRADPGRTAKHLPNLQQNSAGKRINMFLRWMVRRDQNGVDFGLWDQIPMNALYIPLDVHTGSVARKLGLLFRRQDDWKTVVELTTKLKKFDPVDPIRYDYALFGLGSFEKF